MSTPRNNPVEQHGADPVPAHERTNGAWDYFVLLAGLNIALATFLLGGLVVPGLSWSGAILALVTGNTIVSALIALMGYAGVRFGLPAAVASRFPLGHPRGSWFASTCILIALMGWFAINAELAGLAVDRILRAITGITAPTTVIVLVALTNAIPAIVGLESIKWLSRLSIPLLLVLSLWLLATIARDHSLSLLIQYHATGDVRFAEAVDWAIGGNIVGIFIASDLSRYVRSQRANWFGAFAGTLPIVCLLSVIGAFSKLATGRWNPVDAVEVLGLGIPALTIILFSTWTTNDLNLYSAGLSLTNLMPKRARWLNTIVLTVIGTILASLRITQHFTVAMEAFNIVFCPLVGVALVDYFLLRRGKIRVEEAFEPKGHLYYTYGVNPVAWLGVIVGAALGFSLPAYSLRSLVAIVTTGGMYYLGMRAWARSRGHAEQPNRTLQPPSRARR